MTKSEFNNMSYDDLMEWVSENLNEVTDEEILKQYAIEKIEED